MSGVEMGFIITLANSIIGVGILAMPFCFQKVSHHLIPSKPNFNVSLPIPLQCGVLLSILLLIFSNLMTRLTCNYLLQSSIRSRKRNLESMGMTTFGLFRNIWLIKDLNSFQRCTFLVHRGNYWSNWVWLDICLDHASLTTWSLAIWDHKFSRVYSTSAWVIHWGDFDSSIFQFWHFIHLLRSLYCNRSIVMVVVTIICIIPLSLLRSIESLSHVSATSIVFYFCLVLKVNNVF